MDRNTGKLAVREIQAGDVELITSYWLAADAAFLRGMGADPAKVPGREQWLSMLGAQLEQSYRDKQSYCIIWLIGGIPSGHSNVNRITWGEEAYMHLHLWHTDARRQGCGPALVKMTLPYFFENLQLKKLCCEPYALNPAPNKVLEKAGFTFVKQYTTTPGFINFEQPVNHWELSLDEYKKQTS
ncbi:MAG: GNAT family protein [Chitinophagaceae bacterium]